MWKYTHTDEMYHSLTHRNNSDVLYHSDVYLGEIYDDGLRHFKYIKREMVNGRWRYYYSNEEYNAAKKANKIAQEKSNKAYKKARKLDNEHTHANNRMVLDNFGRQVNKAFMDSTKNPIKKIKMKKTQKRLEQDYKDSVKEYNKVTKAKHKADIDANKKSLEADAAQDNYNKVAKKTKIHRSVGTGIVKTANAVSDATYKTKKQIKKGKKAVKKALRKAFPETHTSTTYGAGSKNKTVTKYVNGKKVSEKEVPIKKKKKK